MRFLLLWLILSFKHSIAFSQKPTIDNLIYKDWDVLQDYAVSNNGSFVWYKEWSEIKGGRIFLTTSKGKVIRKFYEANDPKFTVDSKNFVFCDAEGLAIFNLKSKIIKRFKGISKYTMTVCGMDTWVCFKQRDTLSLYDVQRNCKLEFPAINNFIINAQGTRLLLHHKDTLQCYDFKSGELVNIYSTEGINNLTFDQTGLRMAFTGGGNEENIIYYYNFNMPSPKPIVNKLSKHISAGYTVANEAIKFSNDGKHIFFKLKWRSPANQDTNIVSPNVNIWNYQDNFLQTQQMEMLQRLRFRRFSAIVNVDKSNVSQIEDTNNELVLEGNDYLVSRKLINNDETYWNRMEQPQYTIFDVKKEEFKIINTEIDGHIWMSPKELFLVWFNKNSRCYFSYEMSTENIRNISREVDVALFDSMRYFNPVPYITNSANWLHNDTSFIVYDKYDIWELDPLARKTPINLTDGYGRRNKIILRIIVDQKGLSEAKRPKKAIVTALDEINKYNGFFEISFGRRSFPKLILEMDSCLYFFPSIIYNPLPRPIKAEGAGIFLLQKSSSTLSPILLSTTDYKHFDTLYKEQPQRKYNWLKANLIRWEMSDGKLATGVLYTPENFDTQKKYPIIFHYYEKFSDEFFGFPKPGLSEGPLNIPWYVSNGYLIFIPDVMHNTALPGSGILSTVVSAANFLKKNMWIDSTRMGIQGHSYGGYETNFLITHTNIFSAALSAAGSSDLISKYGDIGFGGKSLNFILETGQYNLGMESTPWSDLRTYVNNSPIFFANNVTTPLLLMHNTNDKAVSFNQSLEFFIALRRLQKPVWLLQYNGEGHILGEYCNQLDYTIRQQQFFDHFLKGREAPIWIKKRIPYVLKGMISGLEYDSINNNLNSSRSEGQ